MAKRKIESDDEDELDAGNSEQEEVVKERYNKSKAVHSIMRHVAEATQTPLETLYQQIGWPLDRKYGHSHDAFKLSIT